MIEEVLRLDTPTAGMWRVVMRDCELGGHSFKGGSMIMLRFAAANRDPAKYPDPDAFDVERTNARTHLAFGKGIHTRAGNMLSRKEMTVAFSELLRRVDDIRIKDGAELEGIAQPAAARVRLGSHHLQEVCRMNFDLDENQEMFKAAVERFSAGPTRPARLAARRFPAVWTAGAGRNCPSWD